MVYSDTIAVVSRRTSVHLNYSTRIRYVVVRTRVFNRRSRANERYSRTIRSIYDVRSLKNLYFEPGGGDTVRSQRTPCKLERIQTFGRRGSVHGFRFSSRYPVHGGAIRRATETDTAVGRGPIAILPNPLSSRPDNDTRAPSASARLV